MAGSNCAALGAAHIRPCEISFRKRHAEPGFLQVYIPCVLGACQYDPVLLRWQELLVLYRRKSGRNRLAELRARIMGEDAAKRLMRRREPITLRVLRDIPVPSWKLVFPDKLLQFRPLDGLRADLITVAGLRTHTLLFGSCCWASLLCRPCHAGWGNDDFRKAWAGSLICLLERCAQ
jgi:hypothetical protein